MALLGRATRIQLVNHRDCCDPGNTAGCKEWVCPETGLIAYFLRSKEVIPQEREITFLYQEPTF